METENNADTAKFTLELEDNEDFLLCKGRKNKNRESSRLVTAAEGQEGVYQLDFTHLQPGEEYWFTIGGEIDYVFPPRISEIDFGGVEKNYTYSFFLSITGPAGREAIALPSSYSLNNLPASLQELEYMTFWWTENITGVVYTIYTFFPGEETTIGKIGQTKDNHFRYEGDEIEILKGDKYYQWLRETWQVVPLAQVTSHPIHFNTLN